MPSGFVRTVSSTSGRFVFFLIIIFGLSAGSSASTAQSLAGAGALGSSALSLTAEEQAYLFAHPVLRVHNETDWPPFNFNTEGRPEGYSIDYMNMLAEKLGFQVEYVTGPTWDEFLEMMRDGELDVMLNIADTSGRREFLAFTSPYVEATAGIYVHNTSTGISSMSDLAGKTLAIPKGFFFQEILTNYYPEIKLLLLEDVLATLEAVAFGRADATIGKVGVLSYVINKHFISNVKLAGQLSDTRFTNFMSLATAKSNTILRDILQKGMDLITEQEEIALRRKWSTYKEPAQQNHGIRFSGTEKEYLQQKGAITMCVDPAWLPFEAIDESGQHIGMAADYLQVLQEKSGLRLELIKTDSWVQSLEFAKSRKCDILSLAAPTPERREYLFFTAPYLSFSLVIATRSDEIFVENLEQVIDRRMGVVQGYAMIDILRSRYPGIQLLQVGSVRDGLQKLRSGEIYGFIDAVPTIAYAIQQQGFPDVKIAGNLGVNLDLSIAVRNDTPMLLGILDKTVRAMDPELQQKILNKWISVRYERDLDYSLLWKVVVGFLLLMLLVTYRNRRLAGFNRKIQQANDKIAEANRLLLEKTEELERISITDPLTRVYNRMRLEEVFQHEIPRAERYGKTFSAMMLDLDDFKDINDSYGHPTGDRVLVTVAAVLRSNIRNTDTLGRWGGEEFLIICPETDLEGTQKLAEQLRLKLQMHEFPVVGKVSASFGVACHRPGEKENDLVRRADQALYLAKSRGKNRVEVSRPDDGAGLSS